MNKSTKTVANATTFADLLRQYETQAINPTSQADYTNALITLAKACTYSVLKKCIDVSFNPQLVQVKQSITRDSNNFAKIEHITNTNYIVEYDNNSNAVTKVVDSKLDEALSKLINEDMGDGYDLVNDCIVAILEHTKQAKERNGGNLATMFMETPYNIRQLKKKVYIKLSDSVNGWETVETTPIQEIYRAVRNKVQQSRAVQTVINGYTYLDDLATDSETEAETVIYRRFGKYADIGGAVTDFNGKETAYTADEQTTKDFDELISRLNLTQRQLQILHLRLQGYGYKAVATYLGVGHPRIIKSCKQIQAKCVEIGLTPAI